MWRLAAEAAAESGIEETSRQLDLNPERLRKWVEELGLVAAPAAMEFVELPPLPFGTPGECLVQVDDPSGRKIQVSLKGQAITQRTTVLSTLCEKEATR